MNDMDSIMKPIGKLALLLDRMSMEEFVFFLMASSKRHEDRSEAEHKFLAVVTKLTQE